MVPLPLAWPLAVQPSEGLLLKFSGDLVYLVLIRGSNLDKPLNEGSINLTHAGLQRLRVLWIREMTEEEIGGSGETGRPSTASRSPSLPTTSTPRVA